ncbi:MAG: hypothetical protein K2X73_00225 [Sphingomonas sp.]|uniref:alpha/beta hydrolase n=1 Tax=Sphingomonas sp. TaxID=28214 RepID=UPI0025CF5A1F|nr:hypothetical protein [Sphingomonas sp.]MBX9880374.1 hypothetical protein [Sphingomonas sp.]
MPTPLTWLLEAAAILCVSALIVGAPRALVAGRALRWLPTITAALLALTLVFDPWRWQLVPLFALAIVAFGLGYRRLRRGGPSRRWWRRGVAIALGSLGLLVVALPLALFPLFDLPSPRGPGRIGVADLHLIDRARADPLFGSARKIMVRAWYPATPHGDGAPARYVSRRFAAALLDPDAPLVVLHHLPRIGTAGRTGLAITPGVHPVVIFLPGYQAFVAQSTTLARDLASAGYVVLSVASPGDASVVDSPDGRVRTFRRHRLLDHLAGITRFADAFECDLPSEQGLRFAREVNRLTPDPGRELDLIAGDAASVPDRVAGGGLGALDGHVDPNRVAIVGMSFGGAAAARLCSRDRRCRAGVNLDGFMFGDLQGREIGRPFMVVANGASGRTYYDDTIGRGSADRPTRPYGWTCKCAAAAMRTSPI